MHCKSIGLSLSLALLATAGARPAPAQALTTQRLLTGLSSPVYATSPANDFERLFIVEQRGAIRIYKNGALNPQPFLDIDPLVLGPTGFGDERGLLGLAFHPEYETNGFFYVSYTAVAGAGDSIVARYSVDPSDPDVAMPGSAVTVYGPINQPQSNHNGGCIQFGPDGMLYLGLGDGGSGNDQGPGHAAGGNAQSPTTVLGKMVRLDVDLPFPHIPPDNPFVGEPSTPDEVWSFGLRNPWRFSFDAATGELYIADVGQNAREEVNIEPPGMGGLNYGWRCMEGFLCTGLSGCTCNAPNLTLPVHDYNHAGGRCSVTGGYVYRGCAIPGLEGSYFFADFCSAQIWTFEWDGSSIQNLTERTAELVPDAGSIGLITSFGQDAFGELYILDGGGELFKILPAAGISDCNANNVSDECELAFGLGTDLNDNGVLDACECPVPSVYCQSKFSSSFCFPQIDFEGFATASGGAPFDISCTIVDNVKNGLLFYGFGQANVPFMGGTLCVQPPLRRTALQNSGGNLPPAVDCSGTFSFDMAAQITADPMLSAGVSAFAQYWYRDPGDAFGIGLSNAVAFDVCNL